MYVQTPVTSQSRARRLLLTAAVLAVALVAGFLTGAPRSAAKPKLSEVRAQQDEVRAELDRQNAAIDSMLAEAGRIRAQQKEAEADLAREEAKLDRARKELAAAEDALAQTKRRLVAAKASLSDYLVYLYKSGTIDESAVLLQADGFDDLTTRYEYLDMIKEHEAGVVGRVDELRAQQTEQVAAAKKAVGRIEDAKDAIEARRDSLAAASADLAARRAEIRDARAAQQAQLAKLAGREKNLIEALSTPSPETEAPTGSTGGTTEAPADPVAPPNGSTARINSDGTATPPANAPQAVKDVIAAANQITNTPYVYGGGHGSFESSGYDCSGSVSYALHGGGFLDSPLDSTGFMGWGEAGPGSWITVYANAGHAYMEVAGLRFDTSGAPPRWQTGPPYPAGFVVRHPSGY